MVNKSFCSRVDLEPECLKLKDKKVRIRLEYYLIEDTYEHPEQSKVNTFGIEVVKKEYLSDDVINIEKKAAAHLSLYREKVETLIGKLSENTVTPFSLIGVLDNIIGVSF